MNGFWAFLLGKNLRVELGLSRWCSGKESICQSRRHIRDVNLIPGLGQSLEEGIETYSSILAWKIPWREEPIRLLSMGSQSQTCLLQLSMRGRVGEFLVVHICHEFSKVFVPICTTTSSNFLCSSIVTTSLFHLSHSSGAGALFLSSFDFSINCWHLFFFFLTGVLIISFPFTWCLRCFHSSFFAFLEIAHPIGDCWVLPCLFSSFIFFLWLLLFVTVTHTSQPPFRARPPATSTRALSHVGSQSPSIQILSPL